MITLRYIAVIFLVVACASPAGAQARPGKAQPAFQTAARSSAKTMVDSLRREIARHPDNDVLYFKLSQAYAVDGDSQGALDAIRQALKLKPDKVEYLRAGAQLAAWNKDNAYARALYTRLLKIRPGDAKALLGLARVENWMGDLDCSAKDYRKYVAAHPDDREARIEYAQVEMWRGGYARAMDILKTYRRDFGADDAYRQQKAIVLALAKRSCRSLAIIGPMLAKEPSDYTMLYARTIALANGRRPEDALKSLNEMEKRRPSDPLTADTRLFVTTPLRSTVSATVGYSHDSDNLNIWNYKAEARLALSPITFLMAGGEYDTLTARAGSGLERLDGSRNAWQRGGWIGFRHRFSPEAAVEAHLGGSQIQSSTSTMTYNVGIDFNPSDTVSLNLSRDYGFYLISPRALSLHIRRTSNRLDLGADMGMRYFLAASGGYDTFSDGNRRWSLMVGPRREILRTEHYNLDLGVQGWWFGFHHDYGHGYYAPNLYQRYSLMAFNYWKIDENDGIGFVLAPGYFKDNTMSHFKFGFDVSLEGTFGIYRNWMLQVSISQVYNSRIASGAYRGTSAQAMILRRF